MPTQVDGDMVNMGMATKTSAMAPMAGFDFERSVASMDGVNGVIYQDGFESGHRERTWGVMNQSSVTGYYSEFESREAGGGGGIYDNMALPDHFLEQYYTQVRNLLNIPTHYFLQPIVGS